MAKIDKNRLRNMGVYASMSDEDLLRFSYELIIWRLKKIHELEETGYETWDLLVSKGTEKRSFMILALPKIMGRRTGKMYLVEFFFDLSQLLEDAFKGMPERICMQRAYRKIKWNSVRGIPIDFAGKQLYEL